MLFYYLFWMIMGFIIHFYITFGTNLLTGGPAHIAVLLPVSVFRRKGISNGVQTEWNLWQRYFWEEYHPGDLEFTSEDPLGGQEIGGAPCLVGPSSTSRPTSFAYISLRTLKNIEYQDRSGVPPPQASVATTNLSGALPGTLPEGGSFTGGHLHHPGALHDEEGVVHSRSWGYVPVAMCLISLSCSLSCSLYGTILMYPELCYYSWILWCFSPSTLLWWIEFSLWSYLIGLSL